MSSPWLSSLALAFPPVVATATLLSLPSSSSSDSLSPPTELVEQQNSCWGFQIRKADNHPSKKDSTFKVELSKFGFWEPLGADCTKSKGVMRDAEPTTTKWIDNLCQKNDYDLPQINWGKGLRKTPKKSLEKISKDKHPEAWNLALFSECLQFIKALGDKSGGGDDALKTVVGQFVYSQKTVR